MFLKTLFYRVINFFNKDKLKGRNIGGDTYLYHPNGVYKVDLTNGNLYKLTTYPEIKIEKME